MLTYVTNSLAFVGLRFSKTANFGSKLADHLFVATLNVDMRLIGTGNYKSCRNVLDQLIRQSNPQFQLLARHLADITNALKFKLFFIAVFDTDDHVLNQGTGQAMKGPGVLIIRGARDLDLAV